MTDLATPIEPVETVLAVIGVRPLISKRVEKFTKANLGQTLALARNVQRLAREVVRGELIDVDMATINYTSTLRDLYQGWDEQQLAQMVKSFERHIPAVTTDFMVKAKAVLDYLQGIFPRRTYETLMGPENLVPDAPEVYSFESILDVLDDPLRAMPLIACAAITRKQIQAVRMVYPSLAAAIDEALIEAAAAEKAALKSFELPPEAEIGVKKWMGVPQASPAFQRALQAATEQGRKPPPEPKTNGRTNAMAKDSLSAAQRAIYPGR